MFKGKREKGTTGNQCCTEKSAVHLEKQRKKGGDTQEQVRGEKK